jgi:hypothetical protein
LLYLLLKTLKVLTVMAYAGGALGAVFSSVHEDRERFVYRLCGPGFALIWALGLSLTYVSDVVVLSTWILGSATASIVSLNALLYLAGKPGRNGTLAKLLALGPIALAVILMVLRPS